MRRPLTVGSESINEMTYSLEGSIADRQEGRQHRGRRHLESMPQRGRHESHRPRPAQAWEVRPSPSGGRLVVPEVAGERSLGDLLPALVVAQGINADAGTMSAPRTEPADVPTITSKSRGSSPWTSLMACSAPTAQAMPSTPPPPRTSPRRIVAGRSGIDSSHGYSATVRWRGPWVASRSSVSDSRIACPSTSRSGIASRSACSPRNTPPSYDVSPMLRAWRGVNGTIG